MSGITLLSRNLKKVIPRKIRAQGKRLELRRSYIVVGLFAALLLGAAFWGASVLADTGVGSGSSGSGGSGGGYTWHAVGNGKPTSGSTASSAWSKFYNNSPPCGINCHKMFTSGGYNGISWHNIEPGCINSAYIWYRTDNGSGGFQLVTGSGYSESPSNVVTKIDGLSSPGSTSGQRSYASWRDDILAPYVGSLPSSMSYIYIICSSNLPQPSPSWALSATTSASVGSVAIGGSVKFSSVLTNSGGATASDFCYGPRYFYSSTGSPTRSKDTAYSGERGSNTNPTGKCDGSLGAGKSWGPNSRTETTVTVIPPGASDKYICGTFAFSPYDSAGDKNGRSTAKCVPISSGPLGSGNCPLDSKINANELVQVGLPDQTPSPQSGPGSYTSSRGATYTQYVPSGKTTVSSVQDRPVSPAKAVSVSIPHMLDGYQTTTLSYAPYVTGYPYDANQATVTYRSYYKIETWKASTTVSYYDCRGVNNGTKKACPGGYNGTPMYRYSLQSTSSERSVSGTAAAYQMSACFYRSFQLQTISPTANFQPSGELENPTGVQAASTGTVKFSVKHGGALRTPYKLSGLSYALDYAQACTDSESGALSASGGYGTASETDAWSLSSDPACTNMTPSPPLVGTKGCAEYDFGQSGGEVDSSGTVQSSVGNAGDKNATGCTPKIENEPYLKVFGGDVLAGAGFTSGTTCVTPGNSQILGWNRGNDGSNYVHGSGTEFAAYALSHIQQFASAQGGGVTAAGPPSGLAFANNPLTGGDYGGRLAGAGCIPDYYGERTGDALPTTNLGSPALTQHTYTASSANGLFGTVPAGRQVAMYVSGNVYISGNIMYAAASSVTDLPSLTIVAAGNIYISGNVTRLDGNFIAQNSKIYDCAAGNGTPYAQSDIYANCKNKLTVNGSFVSKQTLFLRAGDNGSLRFSNGDSGPGSNNASEEFNYAPNGWIAPWAANTQPPAYDAITSLPPIL